MNGKRDFRGRFKKQRYLSPKQSREFFDAMYERDERAKEAAHEAFLRTPEGEAWRQEQNKKRLEAFKKNPSRKRHGVAKRKARKLVVRSVAAPKKRMRKRRKITRVRKNPLQKFVVGATITNSGKHWYYRQSTQSFVASLYDATHFKSKTVAVRTARAILKQLPAKIASIHVDSVKDQ